MVLGGRSECVTSGAGDAATELCASAYIQASESVKAVNHMPWQRQRMTALEGLTRAASRLNLARRRCRESGTSDSEDSQEYHARPPFFRRAACNLSPAYEKRYRSSSLQSRNDRCTCDGRKASRFSISVQVVTYRPMNRIVPLLIASTWACTAIAQQASPSSTENSALTQLFKVDQAARQGRDVDWTKLRAEDEERRKQVRHMLDAGEVRTAADYFHAALVFQHGEVPEDYLLAHILAGNAVILGNRDARWLSAATLDRYLNRTGKPQVFGTQFGPTRDAPLGQLPMKADLLSDNVRLLNCVIPLAEQEGIVEGLKNKGPLKGTGVRNCQ